MLLAAAPNAALAARISTIVVDVAKTDANLENLEGSDRHPTRGWDTWFANTSQAVQEVRDQVLQAVPGDAALAADLGFEVRDLAESGGRAAVYQDKGFGFGRGWGSVLDSTLSTLQRASDAVLGASGPDSPPPAPPVTPPTTPPNGGPTAAQRDAQAAAALVQQSIDTIRTVPADDTGSEATKAARIAAFHLNLDAQAKLEPHFTDGDAATVSTLRTADASLEDAAWQLAKKPSPDGRFTGVDIPGALRDSQAALDALARVAG
ncbi:MAG: hypothetical protein JWM98_609 [Thermoleophilia bacterium]|nr:hypothetical protein [Thermoleophilia bacterium]